MTHASNGKRDFFVSYTSSDEPWAEWLSWTIEEAGWSVWFQKWDFRGNFILQMDRSNDLSNRTIGILSEKALLSKQVQAEWDARRAVDPRNERESLILIKVGSCKPPGLLKPFIWLDLIESDQVEAKDELVARLKQQRRKPDNAPPFPSSPGRGKPPQPPRFPGAKSDYISTRRNLDPISSTREPRDTDDKIIRQARTDALVASYLHKKYIHHYRIRNYTVEFVTIAVPVLYFVQRYLTAGASYHTYIESFWEILAGILLVFAVFKLVFRWQDREFDHRKLDYKNQVISQEAQNLLYRRNISKDVRNYFLKAVVDLDVEDGQLLQGIAKTQRQEAFREALKEFEPGTFCPKCGADPHYFKKGDNLKLEACGVCGGIPVKRLA